MRPVSVPLTFRRLALAEFYDAVDWYEQRSAGRGSTFLGAVRKILLEIAGAPDGYPEVHEDVREAAVPGFPYAAYYRIEPRRVHVLAVFHMSRDPTEWQSRV